MRVYWDTSALVRFFVAGRVREITGITRTHSLAELFSALTGRGVAVSMADGGIRQKRLSMKLAAAIVKQIQGRLEFVDLTPDEVMAAIQNAWKTGAQGGRIHDLLHAVAAAKAGADELWTQDRNDFDGLGSVPVKQV